MLGVDDNVIFLEIHPVIVRVRPLKATVRTLNLRYLCCFPDFRTPEPALRMREVSTRPSEVPSQLPLMTTAEHPRSDLSLAAIIGGPVAALAIVLATSAFSNSTAVANVALCLALLTTFVSSVSWQGGITTSITAAACLNFFHTEPVHSLKVTSGSDLLMISLLMALGFSTSYLTVRRTRQTLMSHQRDNAQSLAIDLLKPDLQTSLISMWHHAVSINSSEIALLDVRLDDALSSQSPVVARSRHAASEADEVVLPETGAAVRFLDPRHSMQLLLIPQKGFGAITVPRHVLFNFADQVELALTGTLER